MHINKMSAPFKSPAAKLIFEKSSFFHSKSRHSKIIDSHHFNHTLDVLIPGIDCLPSQLSSCVKLEPYFKVSQLSVSDLIDPQFTEAFVQRGRLSMVSYDTHIDEHDCLAVLPTGHLILHLTKDTYESLGLEGKKSLYAVKKQAGKYVVTLDMTASYFVPGKSNYERVKSCLARCILKFNMICNWIPHDDTICSSSLAVYLACKGYESVRKNNSTTFTSSNRKVPHVICSDADDSGDTCSYNEFYEWVGGVASDVTWSEVDDFVSSTTVPDPYTSMPCLSYQSQGYISSHDISQTITTVREFLKTSESPWASVTVHGFYDSPVSWQRKEHGYQYFGDNTYTYIIFPNDDYWLYTALSSQDICS